ncbi:hypothetical protein [Pseudomonas sp. ME-P-057]|uniref:hypothetical protein n=1 Tax=Pseudomonas sp. ME-P-057 TaxID=3040321 RepID=UPI00255701B2|nr:hypothetical protein [Pseudomonas sp. ME-P-057]
MDVRARELKIWNDLLEHEARRECAIDHWVGELSGHAKVLCRVGVINEEELREMLEYADAAYAHVFEDLAYRVWLKAGYSRG